MSTTTPRRLRNPLEERVLIVSGMRWARASAPQTPPPSIERTLHVCLADRVLQKAGSKARKLAEKWIRGEEGKGQWRQVEDSFSSRACSWRRSQAVRRGWNNIALPFSPRDASRISLLHHVSMTVETRSCFSIHQSKEVQSQLSTDRSLSPLVGQTVCGR